MGDCFVRSASDLFSEIRKKEGDSHVAANYSVGIKEDVVVPGSAKAILDQLNVNVWRITTLTRKQFNRVVT